VHDEQVSKRFRSTNSSQTVYSSHATHPSSVRERPHGNLVDLASIRPGQYHRQPKPTEDPEVKKFKDTVREAEKSTLVFNLNLGRVPIVNQDTMSTRATVALNELAATVEKSRTNNPTPDTMAAIDKGMKFYGRATKSFQKRGDPLSGAYCTVPIRYDFTDKDTRAYAETVLKDKCKLQCTTPYPLILRESIKQVMNKVKEEYPNHYVKVSVDTASMSLKVAYRPMIPAGSKEEKKWSNLDQVIPIPREALDVNARKVPPGFKVEFEVESALLYQATNATNATQGMEVELPDSPSPSQVQTSSITVSKSAKKKVSKQLPL
jgi:hypothetical protein